MYQSLKILLQLKHNVFDDIHESESLPYYFYFIERYNSQNDYQAFAYVECIAHGSDQDDDAASKDHHL